MSDRVVTAKMETKLGDAILRKVAWRLIPFLGLLYFFAFLDRDPNYF